ncbi:SRSF2 [Symbiodinium sp. KB8]|nr:SRSF2 [Symbiodinium sp. KB8]
MARIPDVNHLHSVKIDNITCTQDEVISVKEELREKFSKFGEIGDVYIPRDRNFAFVRYLEKRDAEDAVDAMDGKDIMGQEISVSLSMQVRQENGRGFALQMFFTIGPRASETRGISQGDFSSGRRACWVTPADHIRCHAQLRENGVGVEGAGEMSREAVAGAGVDSIKRLGSQTIAAGDAAGRVRVWHLRRRVLKEVVCVHPHSDPVRAVSSGGDILLTASDDGTVKQLDVLADFVPSDFFTVGVPASAILARGKNVLVGCVDGVVWELSRRLQVPTLLRRLHLGVPVRGLDADPEGPGARVLAVGGGRFGIWLDPAQRRQASPDDEAQQPAFTAKCGPSEAAVVLLPGQPKDLLQVTRAVTGELNCNCEWTPVSSKPRNAHAPRSMVRDPVDSSAVYFIADVTRGATQQPELFKLVPHCPPSVEVLLPGQLEAEESSARVAMTGVEDMKESILPESECQRNEDSDLEEASKPPKSSSYRRLITYPISTKAYRARATGIDPERFFAHPPLFHETIPRGVILSLLVRQRVLNSSASGGAGRSSAIPEPGGKTLDCRQNTEPDILPKHFLYGDIQIPQD